MKKILCIAAFLFFGTLSAQTEIDEYLDTVITETKAQYPIDPKDQTVKNLFDEFYNEVLQSDSGELSEELVTKITDLVENPDAKNMHILSLLLIFQDYLNEASENNMLINPEFQLKLVEALEKEFKNLHQEVPILIFVYKIEALQNSERFDEADFLTNQAFIKFPESVSIKVFQYLATNDENIKNDLIKNHGNHWFVKQLDL